MTGSDPAELFKVRLAARAGALALAALTVMLALRPLAPAFIAESGQGAPAINAALEARAAEPLRPRRRQPRFEYLAERASAPGGGEAQGVLTLRLWIETPSRIVFDNSPQYRRCVEARARRHDEADCPSAQDRRAMVLREDAREAPFVIERARLSRRGG